MATGSLYYDFGIAGCVRADMMLHAGPERRANRRSAASGSKEEMRCDKRIRQP